jgi:hypothetical protein
LFEYIEIFYNRQRLHSALDDRTPAGVHVASVGNREEGRGGSGERGRVRGRVSPETKTMCGARSTKYN